MLVFSLADGCEEKAGAEAGVLGADSRWTGVLAPSGVSAPEATLLLRGPFCRLSIRALCCCALFSADAADLIFMPWSPPAPSARPLMLVEPAGRDGTDGSALSGGGRSALGPDGGAAVFTGATTGRSSTRRRLLSWSSPTGEATATPADFVTSTFVVDEAGCSAVRFRSRVGVGRDGEG